MDVFWFLLSIKFHFQQLVNIQNKDTLAAELTLRKKKITCCDTPAVIATFPTAPERITKWFYSSAAVCLKADSQNQRGWRSEPEGVTVRTRGGDSQNRAGGQLDSTDGVSGLRWSVKQPLGAPRLSVNISPCVRRLWRFSRLLVTVWSADPPPWVPAVSTDDDDDDDDDEGDCWVRLVIDYWWLLRRLISRLRS